MYLKSLDRERIITTLIHEIPTLQALYIFGSQQDGTATNKSDIDIAFLSTEKMKSLQRWDISKKLAKELSQDIDLIELSQTNTIFRYQILSTAERIYGEGYEVESFETLAYSFYLRFQEECKPIVDAICEDIKHFSSIHVMKKWKIDNKDLSNVRCS